MKQIISTLLVVVFAFVLLPSAASPVVASPRSAQAPFHITSITVSVTPATLSLWPCGANIQAVYHAIFHVTPGPIGVVISFSTTTNNGRGQTPEKLTIIPGQTQSDFVWTWQGPLPADHTMPGLGGVMVTSPNVVTSQLVQPSGACR
jgi:hypothetical protein